MGNGAKKETREKGCRNPWKKRMIREGKERKKNFGVD